MSGSLFSPSWYRVASLKPRLRAHARLHRHHYRGRLWYVLHDQATGKSHRLSPSAHALIGLMTGNRTSDEIWQAVAARLQDDAPTQDETIRLLGLLHRADALRCDVTPDTEELFRRAERRRAGEVQQRLLHPLSVRIRLWDPDAFLQRWLWLVRPIFSRAGALVWCLVVGAAAVLAAAHASEIAEAPEAAISSLWASSNLVWLGLTYPCVKALHELGHAFATRVWGGEVHEMGILLLVLMPMPYVDASSASVFPDKRKRMAVAAAGIAVEVFLAAVALFVWLAVEPGLVRSLASNVMWICGVSTLLFNANPLLRFDGYYVLSDWSEIPNLATRSNEYWGYCIQRHLFGVRDVRSPVVAPGEAAWFGFYGAASLIYRTGVVLGIALFIAGRFFLVGVLLALLSLSVQIVAPALRRAAYVLASPRLAQQRLRAVSVSAGLAVLAATLFAAVPLPLYTVSQGVVWLPEGAEVRAGADAFVTQVLVEANSFVERGVPLVLAREPLLEARVAVLEAERRALLARQHAERSKDWAQAALTEEEIVTVEARLSRAREEAREVVIRSQLAGVLILPHVDDLVGRFVSKGEVLGYVVPQGGATARVLVSQHEVELIRERNPAVEVRLASRIAEVQAAQIERQLPAASQRLPTRALGKMGGGAWAVDPTDPEGLRTLEAIFQLELTLPLSLGASAIGESVYVRFDYGAEPLVWRTGRALRRLFLRHFSV